VVTEKESAISTLRYQFESLTDQIKVTCITDKGSALCAVYVAALVTQQSTLMQQILIFTILHIRQAP